TDISPLSLHDALPILGARAFAEVSYLSGADGLEDARAFAHADLDRDGYEDLIVVNRNAPLLRIYRNRVGPAQGGTFVGLSLKGRSEEHTSELQSPYDL